MPGSRSLTAYILLSATWLAMLLAGGSDSGFDPQILGLLYAGERMAPTRVAVWITQLGGWIVLSLVMLAAVAALLMQRRYRDATLFLFITIAGRVAVDFQKAWSARARPQEEHLVAVHSLSFPSGHAANSMIVYLAVALFLAHGRIPIAVALAMSLLIGLTRMALGVHWPSDVIGGWAFGLVWTLGLVRFIGISGTPQRFPH